MGQKTVLFLRGQRLCAASTGTAGGGGAAFSPELCDSLLLRPQGAHMFLHKAEGTKANYFLNALKLTSVLIFHRIPSSHRSSVQAAYQHSLFYRKNFKLCMDV